MADQAYAGQQDYLKRLPRRFYCGEAWVHWEMTIEERRQGWLTERFHDRCRELLTHTLFRFALASPVYCLMPDHMHFMWMGTHKQSDQLLAVRHFRERAGELLREAGVEFQSQAYDHVLKGRLREREEFERVVEYISGNPVRAGIVDVGKHREYPFTECLMPGYPELRRWDPDFWMRFWRIHNHARRNGLMRLPS